MGKTKPIVNVNKASLAWVEGKERHKKPCTIHTQHPCEERRIVVEALDDGKQYAITICAGCLYDLWCALDPETLRDYPLRQEGTNDN